MRLSALILATVLGFAGPAAAKTCPNILFVLDQSSSMAEDPAGGNSKPSKFDLLRDTVTKVINQWGDRVSFGLQLFKADVFVKCDFVSAQTTAKACLDAAKVDVAPAHETAADIIKRLKAANPIPGSKTNTGEAIKAAVASMTLADTQRDNFVILVTDGDPSCNCLDVMNRDAEFTVDAINTARNQKPSIRTIVVGFDGDKGGVNPANLDSMARAGGAPVAGCGGNKPCYYSAADAQKLNDALSKVIDTILGGEFGMVTCDDSCYSTGCPPGQACRKSELDPVAKCQPDPCGGAKCGGDQFCRDGGCIKACTSGCKPSQKCVDGMCVTDPCLAATCPDGQICCPLGNKGCSAGQCIPDLCTGRQCNTNSICDPVSGKCVTDQCKVITCPAGTSCIQPGSCVAGGAGGNPPKRGCSLAAPSPSRDLDPGLAIAGLGLLALALALRRR